MDRPGPAKAHVFSEEQIARTIAAFHLKPWYPAKEFRTIVYPTGHTTYHKLIKSKKLPVTRVGRLLGHTGRQAAIFLLTIEREGEAYVPTIPWQHKRREAAAEPAPPARRGR